MIWKRRFHEAVRSQQGHVVTSEGIHGLCLAMLVPVPWSGRPWAVPFLTVPTRTPATSAKLGRRHRTTPEYADRLVRLVRRWLPERELVVVGDSTFAVVELGHTCRTRGMRLISRLVCSVPWYGQQTAMLELASGTALWHTDGLAPLPVRWVLVPTPRNWRKGGPKDRPIGSVL